MVHNSRQIGVREGDFAERSPANHLARSWFTVSAKKESRLSAQIGMSPTVYDDACNIAPCIETGDRKHRSKLLPHHPLILRVGRAEKTHPTSHRLLRQRDAWFCKQDFETNYGRIIRADGGSNASKGSHLADCKGGAQSLEPLALRHSHLCQETPVAQSDITYRAWHAIELLIRIAIFLRQIGDRSPRRPTSRHHHQPCMHAEQTPVDRIGHPNTIFLVPDIRHRCAQTNPYRLVEGYDSPRAL